MHSSFEGGETDICGENLLVCLSPVTETDPDKGIPFLKLHDDRSQTVFCDKIETQRWRERGDLPTTLISH